MKKIKLLKKMTHFRFSAGGLGGPLTNAHLVHRKKTYFGVAGDLAARFGVVGESG